MQRHIITSIAFLFTIQSLAQESNSDIHINLGAIMNQGMQVGIGKNINDNNVIGLTIADFNIVNQNFDNNNGGTLNGVNQPQASTDLNTSIFSFGVFNKKYHDNNLFFFNSISCSYQKSKLTEILPQYEISYYYSEVSENNDALETVFETQVFDREVNYDNSKSYSYSAGLTSGFGYSYKISDKFNFEAGVFGMITYNNSYRKIDRSVEINGSFQGYWQYDPFATEYDEESQQYIYHSELVPGYQFVIQENDYLVENNSGVDIKACISVSLVFNP